MNNYGKNSIDRKGCKKILVYGYGNPGRSDDALGPAAADWCEKNCAKLTYVSTDSNYQLNIEDSLSISEYDIVIFADASIENIKDFSFKRVIPDNKVSFSTHSMEPSSVLSLCKGLYCKNPDTYILSIKGYSWAAGEGLSMRAEKNLSSALVFLKTVLSDPDSIASFI